MLPARPPCTRVKAGGGAKKCGRRGRVCRLRPSDTASASRRRPRPTNATCYSLSLSLWRLPYSTSASVHVTPHSFIRGIVGGRKCTQFANECKRGDGRLLRRTSCMQSPSLSSFSLRIVDQRVRPSAERANERTRQKIEERFT